MDKEKLAAFNEELRALLNKYEVTLQLEDVPATKKIVVIPIKKEQKEAKEEDKND